MIDYITYNLKDINNNILVIDNYNSKIIIDNNVKTINKCNISINNIFNSLIITEKKKNINEKLNEKNNLTKSLDNSIYYNYIISNNNKYYINNYNLINNIINIIIKYILQYDSGELNKFKKILKQNLVYICSKQIIENIYLYKIYFNKKLFKDLSKLKLNFQIILYCKVYNNFIKDVIINNNNITYFTNNITINKNINENINNNYNIFDYSNNFLLTYNFYNFNDIVFIVDCKNNIFDTILHINYYPSILNNINYNSINNDDINKNNNIKITNDIIKDIIIDEKNRKENEEKNIKEKEKEKINNIINNNIENYNKKKINEYNNDNKNFKSKKCPPNSLYLFLKVKIFLEKYNINININEIALTNAGKGIIMRDKNNFILLNDYNTIHTIGRRAILYFILKEDFELLNLKKNEKIGFISDIASQNSYIKCNKIFIVKQDYIDDKKWCIIGSIYIDKTNDTNIKLLSYDETLNDFINLSNEYCKIRLIKKYNKQLKNQYNNNS